MSVISVQVGSPSMLLKDALPAPLLTAESVNPLLLLYALHANQDSLSVEALVLVALLIIVPLVLLLNGNAKPV